MVTTIPGGVVTIASDKSVTLKAPDAESYLWNTGATTQSIDVSDPGSYSVTITKISGRCVRTSLPTKVIVNNFFSVFPNPANDFIEASLIMKESSDAKLAIYNTFGQKVIEQDFFLSSGDNSTEVSISKLRQGMYLVVVKNDQEIVAKGKFVKL